MSKYTKVRRGNVVHFIRPVHLERVISSSERYGVFDIRALVEMSDVVIDTKTNTIVKLRYNLSDVIEFYLERREHEISLS